MPLPKGLEGAQGPQSTRRGPSLPAPRPLSQRLCGGHGGPGRPLRSWASEMLFFHWGSSQLYVVTSFSKEVMQSYR